MKTNKPKLRELTPEEQRRVREIAALLYFRRLAVELKVPPFPLRGYRPKVTRMQSREQRIVSGQTKNPTRAMYVPESDWNATPIINPEEHVLTREVGPNDRYNSRQNFRTGKATNTANGEGNKTRYRGRRAYGGGSNRSTGGKSFEQLLAEYE